MLKKGCLNKFRILLNASHLFLKTWIQNWDLSWWKLQGPRQKSIWSLKIALLRYLFYSLYFLNERYIQGKFDFKERELQFAKRRYQFLQMFAKTIEDGNQGALTSCSSLSSNKSVWRLNDLIDREVDIENGLDVYCIFNCLWHGFYKNIYSSRKMSNRHRH